jgi:hypothetical protein
MSATIDRDIFPIKKEPVSTKISEVKNTPDDKKEPIFSDDDFSRIVIKDREGSALLQEVIKSDRNWRNRVQIIANKDYVNEPDKKEYKPTKTYVALDKQRQLDLTVQVLNEDGKWIDAGYVQNPFKYLYQLPGMNEPKALNFSELTLDQLKEIFKAAQTDESLIEYLNEHDIFGELTQKNLDNLASQQRMLIDFYNAAEIYFNNDNRKAIPFDDVIEYSSFLASFDKLPAGSEIPLTEIEEISNGNYKIVDVIDNYNEKGLVSKEDTSLSFQQRRLGRYVAKVQMGENTVYIPIRPTKIYTNKGKIGTTQVYKDLKELNDDIASLPNEDTTENFERAKERISELPLFIAPIQGVGFRLAAKHMTNEADANSKGMNVGWNLVIELVENGESISMIPFKGTNSIKFLNTRINNRLKHLGRTAGLDNNKYRKSVSNDPTVETETQRMNFLEEFESLVGHDIVKTAGLRVTEFKTEEVQAENKTNQAEVKEPESIEKIEIAEVSEVDGVTPVASQESVFGRIDALIEKIKTLKKQGKSTKALEKELAALQNESEVEDDGPDIGAAFQRESDSNTELDNIDEGIAFIEKNLPQFKIEVSNLQKRLKDGDIALGEFVNNVIHLYRGAGKTTAYHEAFHAVFRTLLTDEQRLQLLAEAKERYEVTPEQINALEVLFPTYTYSQLENLAYEEEIAKDFENYVLTNESKSFLRRLFDSIAEFFNLFSNNEIDLLFSKINRGVFRNSPIRRKSQAMPYLEDTTYKKLKGGISAIESHNLVNTLTAKTIRHIRNNSEIKNINQAIEAVVETERNFYNFIETQDDALTQKYKTKRDALSTYTNMAMIKAEINKKLSLYEFNE